ncbi:MAG: hypothetical protein ISR58_20755 [Anaerolineales bacterium]|nr:hypothetical protein [Anaerolineales bacterium]
MTSGFDFIYDRLFNSRRKPSPNLMLHARGDILAMLSELAHEQGISIEDLAMRYVEKETIKDYQSANVNVQSWESLSERQQEVAALACLGNTNAEIAERLAISLETVKTHMKVILRKFKVRGRHQLRYILRKWDFSDFDFPPPSG